LLRILASPTPTIHTLSLHDALPIFYGIADFAHSRVDVNGSKSRQGIRYPHFQQKEKTKKGKNPSLHEVSPIVTDPPGNHTEIPRSEEHTSELQSRENLVCRLLLEKK